MDDQIFRIEDIYVPVKRRRTLDLVTVNAIAESMLEEGQRMPILVRRDGERLVLSGCRSWSGATVSAWCWWRAFNGWRHADRSARKRSSA